MPLILATKRFIEAYHLRVAFSTILIPPRLPMSKRRTSTKITAENIQSEYERR